MIYDGDDTEFHATIDAIEAAVERPQKVRLRLVTVRGDDGDWRAMVASEVAFGSTGHAAVTKLAGMLAKRLQSNIDRDEVALRDLIRATVDTTQKGGLH